MMKVSSKSLIWWFHPPTDITEKYNNNIASFCLVSPHYLSLFFWASNIKGSEWKWYNLQHNFSKKLKGNIREKVGCGFSDVALNIDYYMRSGGVLFPLLF